MKLVIFVIGKTKEQLINELKDLTADIEKNIEQHGCRGTSNTSGAYWDYSYYSKSNKITEQNIKGLKAH
jgi:hypothetical protein